MNLLYIALGGALGALARYGTSVFVAIHYKNDLPLATFLTNAFGCFLIGLALPSFAETPVLPAFRLFFVVGFLGAYTTFSTFSLDTISLIQKGESLWALANIIGSVFTGLVMTTLGIWLRSK